MALRLQYGQLTIVVTPAFRLLVTVGEPLAIVAVASQGLQKEKIQAAVGVVKARLDPYLKRCQDQLFTIQESESIS